MTNNSIHTPVLLNEVINNLKINPQGVYVDCTAGFGGHSQKIVEKLTTGKLFCFDQDKNAFDYLTNKFKHNKNVKIFNENFFNIDQKIDQQVDGILFDLGVSNFQLNDKSRGFSYKLFGPLDMRMNYKNQLTAKEIINSYPKHKLINIFQKYGEIKKPDKVVNAIIEKRKVGPITTTQELVKIICDNTKKILTHKHPAKTYFQALRIVVNDELNILQKALIKSLNLLKKQGILLVIAFHSLEDRIVKQIFKKLSSSNDQYDKNVPLFKATIPNYQLINKKPIIPTQEEICKNKKCHSAKLRGIIKIW